jgi:hypothetical protein
MSKRKPTSTKVPARHTEFSVADDRKEMRTRRSSKSIEFLRRAIQSTPEQQSDQGTLNGAAHLGERASAGPDRLAFFKIADNTNTHRGLSWPKTPGKHTL